MTTSPKKILLSLCLLTFIFNCQTFAQNNGQSPAPDTQAQQMTLLKELLKEVKALRQAVQIASLSNQRAQLTLEQSSRQRLKVESLKIEFDQVKSRLHEISNQPQDNEDLKEIEEELTSTNDPNLRAQIARNYQSLKKHKERLQIETRKEQQMLEERARVLQIQLQIEQNSLTELQDKLDAVDQDLEKQLLGKADK